MKNKVIIAGREQIIYVPTQMIHIIGFISPREGVYVSRQIPIPMKFNQN
jgi:hypothetical protein